MYTTFYLHANIYCAVLIPSQTIYYNKHNAILCRYTSYGPRANIQTMNGCSIYCEKSRNLTLKIESRLTSFTRSYSQHSTCELC